MIRRPFVSRPAFVGLTLLILGSALGCGGSPAAPTPTATITLTGISTTQNAITGGVDYETIVTISEAGGKLGVKLTTIELTFSPGGFVTFDQTNQVNTIPASQGFRYVLTSHGVAAGATSVNIVVKYTDDRGVAGSVSGQSSVTVSGGGGGGGGGGGAEYTFVSGSATCIASGSTYNCTGTMVVRINKNYAVGRQIAILTVPTAFQFVGTMNAAPPTNVTFTMTDSRATSFGCPPASTSAIELGNTTFPISLAVTCR